jgi:hypothetical protein
MKDDYVYYLYSTIATYGPRPKFVHANDLHSLEGFISLYAVTKDTAEAITEAGTAAGFKGIVHSERLWLDCDAYEKADAVEERLKERGYDYVAYDTGGRGAHFGINRANGPSHLLPLQDKQWVQENFPECDSSIYTHLHPFRLPGTSHQRTGKRKCLILQQQGSYLQLPRSTKQILREENGCFDGESLRKSIFDIHFIQRNSEACKAGERHPQLIRLIYALENNGYSKEIARWWVGEVNKRFSPPKSQDEIEKALGSIYR